MYYVSVQLLQLESFFGSCTEKYNDWLLVNFSNLEGQIVIDYLLLFLFLLSDPHFRGGWLPPPGAEPPLSPALLMNMTLEICNFFAMSLLLMCSCHSTATRENIY